jgi:predicted transcriptional regulator
MRGVRLTLDKIRRYENRSNIEVISQILQVANGSHATRNKIMYQAFLRYNPDEKAYGAAD